MDPIRVGLRQHGHAPCTLLGVVMFLVIDRQTLGAPMTGRPWLLPSTARWLRRGTAFASRLLIASALLLFVPIAPTLSVAVFPALPHAFFVLLLWLPLSRWFTARGTRAVARILLQALACGL
jgi:hypothetical protein